MQATMPKKNCSIMLNRRIKVNKELNNKQRKSTISKTLLSMF